MMVFFFKLAQMDIGDDIWLTLFDWYSRLNSSVRWSSLISSSFCVRQGVRQGAVLSPILYAAFTNDLLYELEQPSWSPH